MRILKLFIFILFLCIYSYAKEEVRFGLLHGELFLNEKEARIGSNLWLRQMEEQNFGVDFSVHFYSDEEILLRDFKNKQISALVTSGYFYYENKKFLDEESIFKWIISPTENRNTQYYLIKNVNSPFSLSNFKINKVLYRGNLEKVWAEYLFLKNKISSKKTQKIFQRVKKSKSAIFDLFFNKANVAIVEKDLYNSMVDLNPQLKEKIEIVKKSEPIFFKSIGFTKSGIKKKHEDVLVEVSARINKEVIDFGVLSFLQIQKIFIVEKDELKDFDDFYKEYYSLRKKHGL